MTFDEFNTQIQREDLSLDDKKKLIQENPEHIQQLSYDLEHLFYICLEQEEEIPIAAQQIEKLLTELEIERH